MKNLLILCSFVAFFTSCKEEAKPEAEKVGDYAAYGETISPEGALSQKEMLSKYSSMNVGDTIDVKFTSEIESVCQMKGCWVKLHLDPETETMVKFKDYDFSVPKDSEGNIAVVEGKAYVTETSVEDLQHYAKDAGKSDEEIAAITSNKTEYGFLADGVLLKDK